MLLKSLSNTWPHVCYKNAPTSVVTRIVKKASFSAINITIDCLLDYNYVHHLFSSFLLAMRIFRSYSESNQDGDTHIYSFPPTTPLLWLG